MTLSEMRRLLAGHGVRLTRSLGQNFLHDANQLRRIVALAGLAPGDRVLEIGPGLGPLTERLLAAGAGVLGIEKDARLAALLAGRFDVPVETLGPAGALPEAPAPGRLRLVRADALEVLTAARRDWTGWKLVANLPYSVASPILVELAASPAGPDRLVVTLQREVAQRLRAAPGCDDYGVLTLLVQLRYAPREGFRIPATCFFPAPDVESACVALERRDPAPLSAGAGAVFARVVKRAFSQRRKRAIKLLRQDWPADVLESVWAELGLAADARAETLSWDAYLELARRLSRLSPP